MINKWVPYTGMALGLLMMQMSSALANSALEQTISAPFTSGGNINDTVFSDVAGSSNSIAGYGPADVPELTTGTAFNMARELGFGVINVILFIAGIVAVVAIVWAGIRMVASAGDEEGITAGKRILKYAVIGLLVTFIVYMVIQQIVIVLSQSN